MNARALLDAVGVQIMPGQRVLYATTRGTGALQPGRVVRACINPCGGRDHIVVRRDDRKTVVIGWARRVVVMAQPDEADGWLRRQLATLGTR